MIGDAKISGAVDLIEIDHQAKTIAVTDYKTGKVVRNWKGATDYDKIKLHHYQQQLMFYKLLIENSRQFAGYVVDLGAIEFVEPTRSGEIIRLEYRYDPDELDSFRHLINRVWQHIQQLDFAMPTDLKPTIAGILDFEDILKK
jgi:DNA helicase-2/ATP-dependent DNA helicase PcrA